MERKPVVVKEKRMGMWYSTSSSCLPLARDSSIKEKEKRKKKERKKEEIGSASGGCGWMCIPAEWPLVKYGIGAWAKTPSYDQPLLLP